MHNSNTMRAFIASNLCWMTLALSAVRGAAAFSNFKRDSFRPSLQRSMGLMASQSDGGALNPLAWNRLHNQQQQQQPQQFPKLTMAGAASRRILDYRKRIYRKGWRQPQTSRAACSDSNENNTDDDDDDDDNQHRRRSNSPLTPSSVICSGRNLVQGLFSRQSKRRILSLVLCAAVLTTTTLFFFPIRPANAVDAILAGAAPAAEQIVEAAAGGGGYASNPPVSHLVIARPISTAAELALTARLAFAACLGAVIGKERSGKGHHPAGVRTMALVSLGAACFTVCSMYGFSNGVGRYDPSRMASNVASGVGFIGAGVITTTGAAAASADAEKQGKNGSNLSSKKKKKLSSSKSSSKGGISIVHGLTTAAAIWLSAAVGVGCGVGLCILSTAAAFLTLSILRIGRFAQQLQEKEWRLTELRKIRRRREHKPRLKLLRKPPPPESAAAASATTATTTGGAESSSSSSSSSHHHHRDPVLKPSHVIKKHHDTRSHHHHREDPNGFSNITDCVYEEDEDQFVFLDERPVTGWNETDKMDA